MKATVDDRARTEAFERATAHSVFLRDAIDRWPGIATSFLQHGASAAISAALCEGGVDVAVLLRRRRHALALAVALGDLAGELSLEAVTSHLSAFADAAIDRALGAAIAERLPDALPQGLAVLALGKLGSRERTQHA